MRKLLTNVICGVFVCGMMMSFAACVDKNSSDSSGTSDNPTVIDSTPAYNQVDLAGYTTYYFDAENGLDSNDGKSESAPKATMDAAEDLAATATADNPVRLLFKKGTTFTCNAVFDGYQSTKEKPLILDAYGDGEDYPVFVGNGSEKTMDKPDAVMWFKEDNLRVYNLELTGPTAYQAIIVQPARGGVMENIVIEGNYVHDINFNWTYDTLPRNTHPSEIDVDSVCPTNRIGSTNDYGRYRYRKYSGIILDNDYSKEPCWFENAWVISNRVENIGKIGINIYNRWDNQPGFGYGYNKYVGDDLSLNNAEQQLGRWPHRNVYVTGNYVECAGGDAIVMSGVEDGILEKNTSYYAAYLGRGGFWNAGVWVHGSRNIYYQYNEVAYTYMQNGNQDSQGLDIDNSSSNIYCRYNYVHHNEGGGLLLCNAKSTLTQWNTDGTKKGQLEDVWGDWKDNYVYNNVFAYNGNSLLPTRSAFITIARQVHYMYAYNNTVIVDDSIDSQSIIHTEDTTGDATCHDHYYYNNIFYAKKNSWSQFTIGMMYNSHFDNNLFYNVNANTIEENASKTNNDNALKFDPGFNVPNNLNGIANLKTWYTPSNTDTFAKGMSLSGKVSMIPEKDILGNAVSGTKYLGAIAQ